SSVNVCLLERTSPSDPWSVTECRFVSNPTNKLVNFTKSYTCSEYQSASLRYFAFNASEPGVPETYSNTSAQSHVLTKDDIAFVYVAGNESQVNRNGSYTTKFVLYANDTDRNQPAYAILGALTKPQVWFKIHNGTTYLEDGSNTTNSSGYVEYNFDPTCSYDAGKRSWYGYTSADSCFKDVSSSTFNVTIIGDLIPEVTLPDGQTYYRELYLHIPIYGNIKDECSLHNITDALVNFTAISVGYGNQFNCLPVDNLGNGTYNCTFNATEAPEGWYNVRMNATNVTYYNNGTSLKPDSFRIIQTWQPPVLENETVLPEQDWGWGENYTFKVNVSDVNAEDVNVSLWFSPDNQSWSYASSQICYDCGAKTELTFYYKGYSCSDIGTRYFKFNASDAHNSTDRAGINFTLTKDDIEIRYVDASQGNNSWVNRSESVLLKVRIYDTDNKSYVLQNTQGKIWVTKDQVTYDSGWSNTTDEQGYLGVYFTPNCDYQVGLQYWKAGTYQDSCYKDVNSSITLTTNIKGWLNNTIAFPSGEAYLSNQNVTIHGNITDECGLSISDAYVSFRVFHTGFNPYSALCEPTLTEGSAWYNCTWNISNNPSGWYNVEMNSSRSLYN
ncbi:MAG: hypothetical protein ACPLYF_02340, partial [Fervidobacterium sp.]